MAWIATWSTGNLGPRPDHLVVKLYMRSPYEPVSVKRLSRLHPVKDYAAPTVTAKPTQLLPEFQETIAVPELTAAAAAAAWENIKLISRDGHTYVYVNGY
ncbi:hypothetical protein PF010_g5902 [Phytophthora fragariae]|uniref:Uncharacterized protein n=1 Tax=Phytophthora fragariae TaxID=53985 RepID=A0A6G0LM94_9STRA|nr:hypothetical protein PF010_g5902 [Phytophthora fragariae]